MAESTHRTRFTKRALQTAGLGAFFVASYGVATPASFTFTAPNPGWVPITLNNVAIGDVEGDTPGSRDIVGDAANPMLYVAADATHLYFRLRVDGDPLQNPTNFGPFGWGCFIDTDGVLSTYEYSTIIDGVNNPDRIRFFQNTITTDPDDPNDPPEITVETVSSPLTAVIGHAQVTPAGSNFGGTADFFIEWAIERDAAEAAGYLPGQPASFYCGSSNNGTNVDADCSGGNNCILSSQFSDPVTCNETGCVVCGNGSLEQGEGCDDGNTNSGDGCNSQCLIELTFPCTTSPTCESEFCDSNNTCACDDDGDCLASQTCDLASNPNQCISPGCGNGVLEAGEGCDDSNTTSGDGCNSVCLIELTFPCITSTACASEFCDPAGNLCACDDFSDCPGTELCNTLPAPNVCVLPGCGNGVFEPATEACEDGNTTPGDGCNGVCLKEIGQPCALSGECASAFCDPADGTCACDTDADCAAGEQCNTALDPNECVPTGCGNGILAASEGCDDGNTTSGDGCNSQCLIELTFPCAGVSEDCASAFCDPANNTCACDNDADCPNGELCDEAPAPNDCVVSICGDGLITGAEECDDGDTDAGDGCDDTCGVEPGWTCLNEPSQCEPAPCDDDSDCFTCNEHFGLCVSGCDDDADCPMSFFCDEQFGLCVPVCDADDDCPGGMCNRGTGVCVECIADDDCPRGLTCSGAGTCGPECNEDIPCPGALLCDALLEICVECLVDDDCDGGLSCLDGQCLPECQEEVDCGGDPCNETIGVCVECLVDNDCEMGVCDEPVGQCVECVEDVDCPTGVCDEPLNICVVCVVDADCPMGVCDTTVPECVECLEDADCPGDEVCDEQAQVCVQCVDDADCPTGVCDEAAQTCVECVDDADCEAGVCDEAAQECVECVEDTDCPEGETCDPVTNTCSETPPPGCTSDDDCDDALVCNLETGECVQPPGDDDGGSYYAEGGGFCTAQPGSSSSSPGWLVAILGLIGLGVGRARRRSRR
ncbi:MAG: DUF4215 domain-containing protein [Polyangiaceae bacterium]|nr:DUF4215 domain-containing protein [Polyangiaceae bacterium]